MNKVCKDCKIEKEIKEFNKRTASPDGYRHECRLCEKKYKSTFKVYMRNKYNGIIKRSKAENLPLPDMTMDEFILEVIANIIHNNFRSQSFSNTNLTSFITLAIKIFRPFIQ